MAFQRAAQDHGNHDRAQRHMQPVETGQHEESRTVYATVQGQVHFLVGVNVFVCLQADEAETQHDRREQAKVQQPAFAFLQRMMRDGDCHAGGQQQQGVVERQAHGFHRLVFAADIGRTVGRPFAFIA